MPQPLRKWIEGIRFSHDALAERPELAAGISRVNAIWCEIDVELGMLLAVMLGAKAYIGVSMYLALSGSPTQRAALAAASGAELPLDLQEKIDAVLEEMRTRGSERNKVVHAVWSLHPHDETQIISCPPKNLVMLVAKASNKISSTDPFDKVFDVLEDDPPEEFLEDLRCYKEADFNDIVERIGKFKIQVAKTGTLIGVHLDQKRP